MDDKVYTVVDVILAECTLEPIVCLSCRSPNVQFFQNLGDGVCDDCGKWQLDLPLKEILPKIKKLEV